MIILFLHSDLNYEWPECDGPSSGCDYLLSICCGITGLLGLVTSMVFPLIAIRCLWSAGWIWHYSIRLQDQRYAKWEEELNLIGDYDAWPFLRRRDFDLAKKHPKLLAG